MGVVFWLHIKRLQRPLLLPPRPVMWAVIGALTVIALVWPLEMAPRADPLALPAEIPADLFFAFWLPIARHLPAGQALLLACGIGAGLLVVPWFMARRGAAAPPTSVVDEELCVGCLQCSIDCPYGAIEMVERTGRGSKLVARVDSALCVSCGICAGSCSPMGVGPAGRTGRDQMTAVRAFIADPARRAREVVVVCCTHGAGTYAHEIRAAGGVPFPVECGGNLHTSVIELLLRGGASGVMIMACPPRDCRHREGPTWLAERVYHAREAELQARVDRARVSIVHVNASERTVARAALRAFVADVNALPGTADAREPDHEAACDSVIAETRA
jgi:coenzyme F420-reducing hydrogenase delta subunit/Pyruvate/2-oxoacid:ferredoxin oxidoreductase delta subunit